MKASVVLLSAGLDSTVNLLRALQETDVRKVITFNYGQKAATREIERARSLCELYRLNHDVVDLSFFKLFSQQSSLVNLQSTIPQSAHVDIASLETSFKTAASVWVPNRNGIFLNIGAGFAEGVGAQYIIPGFNAEEAATFPDNTKQYANSLNQTFFYSTQNHVEVLCYTQDMDKTQIVQTGVDLGLNFQMLWPCYHGESEWCGECESCQRFYRAINLVGVEL